MSWDEPYGLPSQDAYSGPAMWTVVWLTWAAPAGG